MFHLFENNDDITLKKLQTYLIEKHDLKVGKFILWKCLHSFGFRFKKAEGGRKALTERNGIVNTRINFLRSISPKRQEGFSIVYLDETWIDSHYTPTKEWLTPEPYKGRKTHLNKGQRLVILNAGCKEKGFLPGCGLVFKSISTDGRDYHTEMNGTIFLFGSEAVGTSFACKICSCYGQCILS